MVVKGKVIRRDRGLDDIISRLSQRGIHGATVEITFGDRSSVAAFNEFGTSRIPARPFIRTTFEQNQARYFRSMAQRLGSIMRGKSDFDTQLERIGALVIADLKASIAGWSDPPNAESTIRSKGFNNPLVETGAMMNAIKARIR